MEAVANHLTEAEWKRQLPLIVEDAENGLTPGSRALFAELQDEFQGLTERISHCEQRRIQIANHGNEVCQRLEEALGIIFLSHQ